MPDYQTGIIVYAWVATKNSADAEIKFRTIVGEINKIVSYP